MLELTERQKIAHILRRFGLGASESELDYYAKLGFKSTVDALLDANKTPETFSVDPTIFANKQGTVNMRVMQGHYYLRLLASQKPLLEKVTLFWHNHFATSAEKVDNSFVMANHIDVLRENALGNFKDLLLAVSKDPAMIYWLDNHENVKGNPNENFAREVMELFTLGEGNYTEQDIKEAARAFTGWTFGGIRRRVNANAPASPRRPDRFTFRQDLHDFGQKSVLGTKGDLNGEDVISRLCEMPQTAKFLTNKLWEWFAYPEPEFGVIDRLARRFLASGLSIKELVRDVLLAPEFYSEKCLRRQVKSPIDFTVSVARQLGSGEIAMQRIQSAIANPIENPETGINNGLVRALAAPFAIRQSTKSMGMELLYPPDVSGWRIGAYWITSATMMERMRWADLLFFGTNAAPRGASNLGANQPGGRGPTIGYNPWPLFAENPTPDKVVEKLTSVFDVELAPSAKSKLVEAATKAANGRITQANAGEVARLVCRVLFASPEFQFC